MLFRSAVKQYQEKGDSRAISQRDLYNLVKDLTWEDVIADFNKFEGECLHIERHNRWQKEDGSWEDRSYKDFLHDIIRKEMQEELYNYADDYEEDFHVEVDISEGK